MIIAELLQTVLYINVTRLEEYIRLGHSI